MFIKLTHFLNILMHNDNKGFEENKEMNRKLVGILSMAAIMAMTAGCGKKVKEKKAEAKKTVVTQYGEVVLPEYQGLSVEKDIYTVTDSEIQDEIDLLVEDYATYKEVARGAKENDILTMTLVAKTELETVLEYTDETVEFVLGQAEYGEEVDKKLLGVKAGEHRVFTVPYEEEYWLEESVPVAGDSITFEVDVKKVVEKELPELTDSFVSETLGYESYDALKEEVAAWLQQENDSNSEAEVKESLVTKVVEGATAEEGNEELYALCKKEVDNGYAAYASLYGSASLEEFYEVAGITTEQIEEETKGLVKRAMVLAAICKEESLSVSDEEYKEGIEEYVQAYGYEDEEALLKDYEEAEIRNWLLEEKAIGVLREHAVVTEKKITADEQAS